LAEQRFERVDFGEEARTQARVLLGRQWLIQLAAPGAEIPDTGAFEQVDDAICLTALEPVTSPSRPCARGGGFSEHA
jgi:hypothetical protein